MNYKLPGGPLKGKPIQGMNGEWYDPVGNRIEFRPLDREYSGRFWEQKRPWGFRDAMIGNIASSAESGNFSLFVGPSGISQADREKMSAYRVLAGQMGYDIGDFVFNGGTFAATAQIKKAPYMARYF